MKIERGDILMVNLGQVRVLPFRVGIPSGSGCQQ